MRSIGPQTRSSRPFRYGQRDEQVHRLLGFRWGYTENADAAHHPVAPLPLTVTTGQEWNTLLPILRKNYPGWHFAQSA